MLTYSLILCIYLFKSYCCSLYGFILWKFCSPEFDKTFKSWNISIRTLLKFPYNTHTFYLGPLIDQLHLRQQLYIRSFRLLCHACRLSNGIVKTCTDKSRFTSNTLIGYKLSFYRNMFNLDLNTNLNLSTACLSVTTLDQASLGIISNVITLLNVRAGQSVLDNFIQYQIGTMIVQLALD